ncbi:exported hypothetical protein [Paraburkholderia caribensis]|nr:exported hypothetical protein [Paraburkholderia caribensis]
MMRRMRVKLAMLLGKLSSEVTLAGGFELPMGRRLSGGGPESRRSTRRYLARVSRARRCGEMSTGK